MTNTATVRPDVYSRITDKIIADLEQGVRPWLRPWNADHAAGRGYARKSPRYLTAWNLV